jgi:hypothetical protein
VGNFAGQGGGTYGGILYNCTLVGNSSIIFGGGAFVSTLNDCTLAGNTATNGGAAAYCTLNRCILTNNQARFGGGADHCTLNNCAVIGNSAGDGGGGGINIGTLNNSVVISNTASTSAGGGAIGATLNNCTVVGNVAKGGGVYDCQLNNCIVEYNSQPNYIWGTLNYCCTTPTPTNGVGNITNAPVFIDQTGGNFRLQPTSPCINAGNNAFVFGSTDLDGNPRIVGGTVDMGAYEFQGTAPASFYAWLQQYGLPTDGSADFIDTDGDGMNNWQEWVCGTNPTNALSCLRLVSAVPTSTNVTVTWQSVAAINYFLERSTNLVTPFTLVASNILGQTGTTSSADTNASGARPFFYRVGIAHP